MFLSRIQIGRGVLGRGLEFYFVTVVTVTAWGSGSFWTVQDLSILVSRACPSAAKATWSQNVCRFLDKYGNLQKNGVKSSIAQTI